MKSLASRLGQTWLLLLPSLTSGKFSFLEPDIPLNNDDDHGENDETFSRTLVMCHYCA